MDIPTPPKGMGREEAYRFRLTYYHQLFTEAIEKYKKKHHGRLPLSYPVLADISGISLRTVFTWVKRINESRLLPRIEVANYGYRLTWYANLFKKFIEFYQATHNDIPPTQKEIANVLGITQSAVSQRMKRIRESGLLVSIRTRGYLPSKKKKYVSDEEIIRAYSDFGRKVRYRKVPTQIQLGDKLKVHHTTLSLRLKELPIRTRGMSPKKKRRYIDDKKFLGAFNKYRERHGGSLPSQSDLAKRLKVDQLVISYRLLKINIKNLAEGKPFLRTRGFKKLIPRKPKRFTRSTPPSLFFENLEDAVGGVCSRIERILRDEKEIKNLAQFPRVKSVRLVTSFLLASKKALERYIRERAFFITPGRISGPKEEVMAYCEGNNFYIYQEIIDPRSKSYKEPQFLAIVLFETLVTSLFVKSSRPSDFTKEIQGALFR